MKGEEGGQSTGMAWEGEKGEQYWCNSVLGEDETGGEMINFGIGRGRTKNELKV